MQRNSELQWEDMSTVVDLAISGALGRKQASTPSRSAVPQLNEVIVGPRNRLLSARAMRLIEALPRSFRLHETRLNYPHVLEQLSGAWHDPRQFAATIDELTLVDRPNRSGFPFPVLSELCNVRDFYFAEVHPEYRDRFRRGPL